MIIMTIAFSELFLFINLVKRVKTAKVYAKQTCPKLPGSAPKGDL
jgi:hypothetical protein